MSDKPKVSKLSFKGDKPKKKKKRDRDDAGDDDDEEALAQAAAVSNDPLPGEGKLTSSGVVVMGHDTNFAEQIAVGDSLLVTVSDRFRNTHDDEMRVVNMVLGRSSLNLSAPFSCDLTAPTSFMVLKKAPDIEALKAARAAEKKRLKKLEEESSVVTCARVHCRLSFVLARLFSLADVAVLAFASLAHVHRQGAKGGQRAVEDVDAGDREGRVGHEQRGYACAARQGEARSALLERPDGVR